MTKLISRKPPKLGQHKGYASVYIDGRRVYLGKHGSVEAHQKYQQLVQQWREDRESAAAEPPPPAATAGKPPTTDELLERKHRGGKIRLVELCAAYHLRNQKYYRKNGQVTREAETTREVLVELVAAFPDAHVDDIGPRALKRFRELIIEKDTWCRSHLNKQIGRLKRMYRWGVEEEIVEPDAYQRIASLAGLKRDRCQARETEPVKPVDDAVVEATLPYLADIVADMVRVQRMSGARPGEICILRPIDVDRSKDVWEYRPSSHKTQGVGKDRVVYFGPQCQHVLAKYLLRPKESFCFDPRKVVEEMRRLRRQARRTPLSCGNRAGSNRQGQPRRAPGNRYDTDSFRKAIHRACDRAFPPAKEMSTDDKRVWRTKHRWSPHQLRHTAATEVRKEFGIEGSQVHLGHASADVTQIYAERDAQLAARIALKLG